MHSLQLTIWRSSAACQRSPNSEAAECNAKINTNVLSAMDTSGLSNLAAMSNLVNRCRWQGDNSRETAGRQSIFELNSKSAAGSGPPTVICVPTKKNALETLVCILYLRLLAYWNHESVLCEGSDTALSTRCCAQALTKRVAARGILPIMHSEQAPLCEVSTTIWASIP